MSHLSQDGAAAQAVRHHHAQLADGLVERAESLQRQVETAYLLKADRTRRDLVDYLRREILPHARAEEQTMYPAAAATPAGGPLVTSMLAEHTVLAGLVADLAGETSLVRAAGTGRALAVLFTAHLAKENDLILPMLLEAPGTSLAALLAGMHDLLGAEPETGPDPDGMTAEDGGCSCGDCGCGGQASSVSATARA